MLKEWPCDSISSKKDTFDFLERSYKLIYTKEFGGFVNEFSTNFYRHCSDESAFLTLKNTIV